MKKLFSISVAVILCMSATINANAQKSKSFAGTVKFSIRYEGDTDPQRHIPQEITYTILGNKTKMQQQVFIQIQDGDAVTSTTMFDIPGYRVAYTKPKADILEQQSTVKYTYTKGSETKTICGYVCDKYDITVLNLEDDEEMTFTVYTTTEVGDNNNINAIEYPGLTGYPLYTEVESNGVKTILEAVEMKKTKVKSVDFLMPSDYKVLTKEEFQEFIQQLFGGGGEE